jgi:hypothetical protein
MSRSKVGISKSKKVAPKIQKSPYSTGEESGSQNFIAEELGAGAADPRCQTSPLAPHRWPTWPPCTSPSE